jgi:hypothetical protein
VYDRRYELYRELFRATQPIVHELARSVPENGAS